MSEKKLNAVVLSDIHVDASAARINMLRTGLKNVKRTEGGCDLFVSAGDTTDHGDKEMWFAFQKTYEEVSPADEAILAFGNHDSWTRPYGSHQKDTELERAMPLYKDCRRKVTGDRSGSAYYYKVVNGVPFIMLGTSGSAVGAEVDEAQISWFRETIKKAAELDTFIFVISHWALKNTHGLPYTFSADRSADEYEGSLGDGGELLRDEMKKYKDVILISGHSHMGWTPPEDFREKGWASVEGVDGIVSVNLPCFMFPNHDGEHNEPGIGLSVRIDGIRADICPVNYLTNTPLRQYGFTLYHG